MTLDFLLLRGARAHNMQTSQFIIRLPSQHFLIMNSVYVMPPSPLQSASTCSGRLGKKLLSIISSRQRREKKARDVRLGKVWFESLTLRVPSFVLCHLLAGWPVGALGIFTAPFQVYISSWS